jgi:uncharacterized iron-regulated protein
MFYFDKLFSALSNTRFNSLFNSSVQHKAYGMSLGLIFTLSGCAAFTSQQTFTSRPDLPIAIAHSSAISTTTYFDYQLRSPQNQLITMQDFIQDIKDADVVLVGEWHTHTGIHRFQTELLRAMFLQNPELALSMEMFSRDSQTVVDQYLAGEIGEQALINQTSAWPNYESDYRPLVEFSKAAELDIIAANAPKDTVRCIGKAGIGYIDKLPDNKRTWLADTISTEDSAYKTHFLASMHHGDEAQNAKQFAAQVTWDETMAESIVRYLERHPNHQVMHIAGKFHIENGLGTAASILVRAPELKVVIVTPVGVNETPEKGTGDYRLQVIAPPQRFVKEENMMASFKALSERNKDLHCIK